jgi:hypothetical protein
MERLHHAVTPAIDVSIAAPLQQSPVFPAETSSLIVEHDIAAKLMLQPFDMGEPEHVLPTVSSVPTFVELQ